jgi:hypothetical protein
MTIETFPDGATDSEQYFSLSMPLSGGVRVSAAPTLATVVGTYKIKVEAYLIAHDNIKAS